METRTINELPLKETRYVRRRRPRTRGQVASVMNIFQLIPGSPSYIFVFSKFPDAAIVPGNFINFLLALSVKPMIYLSFQSALFRGQSQVQGSDLPALKHPPQIPRRNLLRLQHFLSRLLPALGVGTMGTHGIIQRE